MLCFPTLMLGRRQSSAEGDARQKAMLGRRRMSCRELAKGQCGFRLECAAPPQIEGWRGPRRLLLKSPVALTLGKTFCERQCRNSMWSREERTDAAMKSHAESENVVQTLNNTDHLDMG
jgi:hypothetical protein